MSTTTLAPTPTVPAARRTRPRGAKDGWLWSTGVGKCLKDYHGLVPKWVSHAWRYPDGTGRNVLVAEPYQLTRGAYEDFLLLHNSGWTVTVTAADAVHCPGGTVAVVITPRQ